MKFVAFSLFSVLAACGSSSNPPAPAPSPTAAPAPAAAAPAPAPGVAARSADTATRSEVGEVNPRLLRRFKPLRPVFASADEPAPSEAQVDLGRMLFFDKRLSRDRDLSCNSCHALDHYGVDNESTSSGAKGARGHRNSPSVYNAAGQVACFWDGRAGNVEEQAKGPILNPGEMAMPDAKAVVAVLQGIPGYVAAFRTAFPGDASPVSYDNLGRAIGAFERKLVTPSRWDRYLAGDHAALTAPEVAGLKLFTDIGCMTCHTGELVGGSMFQTVGVVEAWPNQADQGRYDVTKVASDHMMFKVPSLRNVAKTAPYFHDGSARTLDEAVTMMARHQLGEELSKSDVAAIVTWLGSLTGELPAKYIAPPHLPE
ncbi:MAG TPA: cytochrome c peroxidase [Kofleriaceae bacterium]|nr:cytochrome c peroxidase [Kofleriaceae bacterium]